MVAACTLLLVGGFALKGQCILEEGWSGEQWERLCYNDIQPLYEKRGVITNTFPYITAYLAGGELKGGGVEYPVLTGMFMWGAGYLAEDQNEYLAVSAVLLAPFALLIAWLLARMAGLRALYWAAAPSIVLYAFHNWDLLVVAAAVTGMYLWWTGRYTAAAIAFGIGGALKLYPLLLLAPLFLDRWTAGDRDKAWRTGWWGLGSVLAINFPFMYWNPPSWWLTYRFHSLRYPNIDSLWGQTFPSLDPGILNPVSGALTAASLGVVLWWGVKRARAEGAFPFLQIAAACVCAFLLWSKVQSPQYMLWILPFFVVLKVRPAWWVAAIVIDVAAYVGVFRFFHDFNTDPDAELARFVMIYSSFARAALWAFLIPVFARAETAIAPLVRAKKVSQPAPTLTPSEA